MKVVHVVRQYLPSIGGLEEVVRCLAISQLQAGVISPSIVTLNRVFRQPVEALPIEELIEGVPVARIAYWGSERYPLAPTVLAAIRQADLVHVHGIDFFFDFLAATCWLHGKPLVASTHGGFFHTSFASRLKQVYFRSVTRLSSRSYAQIISTSENDGEIFKQIVSPQRLAVIENGVDVTKFADAAARTTKPVLIYFGRWSENKGLLEALALFSALHARQPEVGWRFIIAGRAYDLNAQDLARHAAELGVADCVDIVANPTQTELCDLITRASYFICLSQHEGFGIAAVEAMSAGLTPILSDIPPFRRLLEFTGRGLLLSGSRIEDSVSQIVNLDSAQQVDLSTRQQNIESVQCYAWDSVQDRYFKAYQMAVSVVKQ